MYGTFLPEFYIKMFLFEFLQKIKNKNDKDIINI